jgi:chromosome segregation protein
MFKLQRLEITGFKSFADYTEIVFTGNGITAVVGPNGCGKSNVSDSISWVLGEQRAKSLRGGEMKDVVFQGTKTRKPSGMAEVVLHMVRDEDAFDADDQELEDIDETLSNIDELAVDVDAIEADQSGLEPEIAVEAVAFAEESSNGFHSPDTEEAGIEKVQAAQVGSIQTVERTVKTKRHWRPRSFALDFAPGEAVSVTRRLYLSGESEYLLNGKTCRLRDIQDLFAGTGLSGSHYAIIEQGRIGQILSAKPGDRRNLIEEAAGISKFRTRQRAAESRLDSAKTNLGRISDIVSEIEKQANSLRRQAAKTRRYVVLQEEFRVLLRQLFAAEGRHFSALIEELGAKLTAAVEVEKSLVAKVAGQEEAFRESTQNARLAEEELSEVRRLHAQNALERDRADREHRYQSEQILNLSNRAEAIQIEIESATERLALAESERKRLEVEEEKESAEADESRLILIEAEKQYSEKVDDVKKIEAEMDSRRGELIKHTAAVERFDEIARQLALNVERLTQRAAGLGIEGKRAEEAHTEHIAEAANLASEIVSERGKLEGLNSEKVAILQQTVAARDVLRSSEEGLRTVHSELLRTRNRLETLQELEETRAVYAPQVQKIFAEQERIGVSPKGVLADFLNVNEAAERAVESLFGSYLQTILVENVDEARTVSTWLASNRVGRVSVLIAPGIQAATSTNGTPGSPTRIEDALGASAELSAILKKAFPREMSALLVDEINESTVGSDVDVFVASNGDILVGGGLFVSGQQDSGEKNSSLLAFKRELSGLEKSVAKLDRSVSAAEQKVVEDRQKLSQIEERTVDLQSVIIKVERHLLSLEMQEKTARQEIERAERHRKVVVDESEQIAAEIAEVESRIEEAKASRVSAEEMRTTARTALEEIAARLAAARDRADAENAVLNEKRTLAATSGERRRSAQSALRRVENEQKELEARLISLQGELSSAETKIAELRTLVADIAGRISGVETDLDAEQKQLADAMEKLAGARASADASSEELAELNRKAAEAMNERAAIEVRQAEAVTELKNASENCSQELNIALKELVETEAIAEDFVLGDARARVEDLRQRLESFGAINMLAVEELAETEERLLFLTSQRQDIIESIASAEEALREIKERSRERFKHAFEAINENFKVYFSELFGGGRGEMTLLESDDILEAGIEVVAQPPGKRLQNILLLSGGEKAMTAISLVLAIFKYRPSPFCLLDEVDAPLDDANVGRFVNKIAGMSEKTQFIVITHNKRTMEAARALYGVTMQEAGVSKVVSVKFD